MKRLAEQREEVAGPRGAGPALHVLGERAVVRDLPLGVVELDARVAAGEELFPSARPAVKLAQGAQDRGFHDQRQAMPGP